jgi:hypothetical protein
MSHIGRRCCQANKNDYPVGAGIGESIDVKIGFVVIDSPDVIGLVGHRGFRGVATPSASQARQRSTVATPFRPVLPLRLCGFA